MLDGEEKQEIIIVKRVIDGGDGHHGGAWKIAFADFMTAMMALFLVLWLVNAANEKTKKAVASYFNPVKLVDRSRSSRGLDDTSTQASKTEKGAKDEKKTDNDAKESKDEHEASSNGPSDEALFNDPFNVLNGIAQREEEKIENSELKLEHSYVVGTPVEDAFLDPFAQAIEAPENANSSTPSDGDPVQKNMAIDQDKHVENAKIEADPGENDEEELTKEARLYPADGSKAEKIKESQDKESEEEKSETPQDENKPTPSEEMAKLVEMASKVAEEEEKANQEKLEKVSKEILTEIKERLAQKLGISDQVSESLSVEVTKDGVLISITDQFGFSMFKVGSAVPRGQLVLAMNEISNILSKRVGMVRVYGHTDSRPYGGGQYDNWRLSTARAHTARLMLVRGGLKAPRISQVVGFADRKLREPDRPEADANRRIEILLEVS